MKYRVLVSKTFQKQFISLENNVQRRVKSALKNLENDPFQPRSGADVKRLSHANPIKYRLRVGNYRIIYTVSSETVSILEIFRRGKDYGGL